MITPEDLKNLLYVNPSFSSSQREEVKFHCAECGKLLGEDKEERACNFDTNKSCGCEDYTGVTY